MYESVRVGLSRVNWVPVAIFSLRAWLSGSESVRGTMVSVRTRLVGGQLLDTARNQYN